MDELGSTFAKLLIETLLNVHALTNMHRSSGNDEYRKTAAGWLPSLRDLMTSLERELTKEPVTEKTCERCDGTGWLGHGQGGDTCGSCHGTGKVKI
jgi:DnaJ-class molecular chaperone